MKTTSIKLRNKLIYQVFVRNHTPEGTFQSLISDLDRIHSLGTDIVYLLPIHPIGKVNRKGTVGSPYSIRDYRKIDPELGTLTDFQDLISAVHKRKMKLMMDVVYNHTSRDSSLLENHPEWFYRDANGQFANRVGEWWDVTDLNYSSRKVLWNELADTLAGYAKMGVDGFRCDVANLVPLSFWSFARKIVSKINKKILWFSESVHGGFVKYIRDSGFEAASESEIFTVFDMAYDYDIHPYFSDYLKGKRPLREYLEAIARQDEIYPANYVKVKNLENHDFDRIAELVDGNQAKIRNWWGLNFFQKGAVMIYAGSEYSAKKRPNLFEKDIYERREDISPLIKKLASMKKRAIFSQGIWKITIPEVDGVAVNTVETQTEKWTGIFNVGSTVGNLPVSLPDGDYRNYLSNQRITVKTGLVPLGKDPLIIRQLK